MLITYPCSLRVAKSVLWLFPLMVGLFLSTTGRTQDSTSTIWLPASPQTYIEDLQLISERLNVHLDHDPISKLPELNEICLLHGRMTFKQFFAPLKSHRLMFLFMFPHPGEIGMLIIKRAPSSALRPGIFRVKVAEYETGDPMEGVSVFNLTTHKGKATDDKGMVSFEYETLPVEIIITNVGRRPDTVTIQDEDTTIFLVVEAQWLGAASAPYAPTRKAVSTKDYSTLEANIVSYPFHRLAHGLTGIASSTVPSTLEGRVAGVLVTSTSGIPGSYDHVTIRGQTSVLNGVDPLYVIDGVPEATRNASLSTIQSGNASKSLSAWSFIAPGDIERIDVLRDADATAIYGSRGANGVVLVTTKHWKVGAPKWDVEFSAGTSSVTKQPAFMNTSEYLGMRREALHNSGLPDTIGAATDLVDTSRNIDWGKWLLGREARNDDIKFAVSGGERHDNYTMGMEYFKENTPFPTQPDHDRLTSNFNYNHRSLDRRLAVRFAGLAGWDANHQCITYDPAIFRTLAPDAPAPLDQYGQLNFPAGVSWLNPLSQIRQPYDALSSNYLLSLIGSYALTSHLVWQTTFGINRTQTGEFGAMPLADQDPTTDPQATGFFSSTRFVSRTFEPQLQYKRHDGKLLTSWLGGASLQGWDENATTRTDTGYASDIVLLHHGHAAPLDTSSQVAHETSTSFFTNLNANWSDKYILNIAGRRDGSSRFPTDKRWGYFGSVAAAWIFFDTKVHRNFLNFITYGKIKASQGITGNTQLGDRTLQYIAGTSIQSFQTIPGLYPSGSIGEGWEKTYKSEVSLDLGFWQNRVLFNATAYRHRSDDLLQNPGSSTSRVIPGNGAWPIVVENSGYELSLSGTLADNRYLRWDIAVNWSFPKSRLASFPDVAKSVYANRLAVGQSLNVLRGYVYTGVDKQSGLYTFADLNHDGRITEADQKILGKFDVTGFGGFENTIRWKQLQLQVLVDARIATGFGFLTPMLANNPPGTVGVGLSSNYPRALLNHWRQPGDVAAYQRIYAADNAATDTAMRLYLNSSALFANASFLRLRNVRFSYDLPVARAAAMHLSALSIFIDAQNLFTVSSYKADPEIQSVLTTPTMRSVEVGVRVGH